MSAATAVCFRRKSRGIGLFPTKEEISVSEGSLFPTKEEISVSEGSLFPPKEEISVSFLGNFGQGPRHINAKRAARIRIRFILQFPTTWQQLNQLADAFVSL